MTVEVGEFGEHVEGVEVDEEVVLAAGKTGARSAVEDHFVTEVGRQRLLDVLVRQIQRLVEDTVHLLQFIAVQFNQINQISYAIEF